MIVVCDLLFVLMIVFVNDSLCDYFVDWVVMVNVRMFFVRCDWIYGILVLVVYGCDFFIVIVLCFVVC